MKRALRAAYTPDGSHAAAGSRRGSARASRMISCAPRAHSRATRASKAPMLVVERDGRSSCSCSPRIEGHPFASATQERVMPAIERARSSPRASATKSPVEIVGSGAIQHASAAAERATHEITTFGTHRIDRGGVAAAAGLRLDAPAAARRADARAGRSPRHTPSCTSSSAKCTSSRWYSARASSAASSTTRSTSLPIVFAIPRTGRRRRRVPHVGPAILLGLTTTLVGYLVLARGAVSRTRADRRVLHDRAHRRLRLRAVSLSGARAGAAANCRSSGRASARRSIACLQRWRWTTQRSC